MKFVVLGLFVLISLPLIVFGAFRAENPTHPYAISDSPTGNNLQNISLLYPAQNVNPAPSLGGAEIVTVEEKALLPVSGPLGTIADLEENPVNPGNISLYIVREGDTLSDIAEVFGVTVDTIRWANDIPSSQISEGEILVILPVSGVLHAVQEGETLAGISNKYDVSMESILEFNNLESEDLLSVGFELTIPEGTLQSSSGSGSRSSSSVAQSSTSSNNTRGYFIRPIDGGYKSQGIHGFNAVDIAAPVGTSIYAAGSGVVEESRHSGWNGGYGTMIMIRHDNGTKTLYAHNSQNIVDKGQSVVQGQIIGYVGSTGRTTGAHLHFEVRGDTNPF